MQFLEGYWLFVGKIEILSINSSFLAHLVPIAKRDKSFKNYMPNAF
jgi:hypothetical protein